MITTIPQSKTFAWTYRVYVTLFFIYLALPLTVVCAFAFNDSVFPSLPWDGFTWAWFFGNEAPYIGVFNERPIIKSIGTSLFVAFWVSLLSIAVGTSNAFLFVRYDFTFKELLSILMLFPIRAYLYYKVLEYVNASELMWFLFWIYLPLSLLLGTILHFVSKDDE